VGVEDKAFWEALKKGKETKSTRLRGRSVASIRGTAGDGPGKEKDRARKFVSQTGSRRTAFFEGGGGGGEASLITSWQPRTLL